LFRFDEQVNLVLESQNKLKLKELPGKYVRVSCLTTINHLKKFIALRCLNSMDKYKVKTFLTKDVAIFYLF
jgi:hypothetical protein